ncbi:MAG: LptF/LptG family permease [Candidatus Krumholzibacteriia bacterium]
MYLIYKHLLRATAGPFAFGFFVSTFVLIINDLYRYVGMFVTKGVPFLMATEVLFLSLGYTLALSIPMAVLIGVLMGVGQLAADHEIVALKASGVGLDALLRPLLAGGIVVALCLTAYNHYILPEANHRLVNLLFDINRKKPMLEIRPQMFAELNDRVTIWVEEKDDRTGRLTGVRILEKARPGDLSPQLTTATWGLLVPRPAEDAVVLELHDGEIHRRPAEGDPSRYDVVRFVQHNLYVRNTERDLETSGRTARGDREMNLTALRTAARAEHAGQREIVANTADLAARLTRRVWGLLDPQERAALLGRGTALREPAPEGFRMAAIRAAQQEVELAAGSARVQVDLRDSRRQIEYKYLVEYHKKFAIPFACLVFVLWGLPLSLSSVRSGRGVSVATAMAIYLVYYLFLIGGEKLADRGRLSPFLAMWAANLLLTVIGIPIAVRAIRESPPLRLWPRRSLAAGGPPAAAGPGSRR